MEINGKTAIITGAGSGIGRATVDELSKQNATAIALVDLSVRF